MRIGRRRRVSSPTEKISRRYRSLRPLRQGRNVSGSDEVLTMQAWLRHEWKRAGLPLRLANEARGVRNAATRKYLTADHLWYYPPIDTFVKLAA